MLKTITSSLAGFFEGTNPAPPTHLGRRYDAAGNFLLEPGNTVVSHLVEGAPSQAAVIEVRERMLAMPDADRLAFTPISSLHMTLFQGIIEYRRRLPYWPSDVPLDTGIDDMTRLYLERLRGFEGHGLFNVKVIEVVPTGLTVAGATEQDRRILTRRPFGALRLPPSGPRHLCLPHHLRLSDPPPRRRAGRGLAGPVR